MNIKQTYKVDSQRRGLLRTLPAVGLLGLTPGVWAQGAYPNRPLRVIVPQPPGGGFDFVARALAERLTKSLGQSLVVENRSGSGTLVGTDAAAKADPDGYSILVGSVSNIAINMGLYDKLSYDSLRDFEPVGLAVSYSYTLMARKDLPINSLKDLVAFAKANPGKLNIGSINVGSTQHLAAELFKATAGIDVQVVPFNGTPAVLTALRGGQIDLAVEILAPVLPQIKGQALRALAVTGDKRSAALPQVPTAKEAGVKNLYAASWNALAVPSKTPRDIVQKLNQEIQSVLNSADVRKKLLDMNVDPQPGSLQQAADLLNSETKRWGEVIQRAGIPKQ